MKRLGPAVAFLSALLSTAEANAPLANTLTAPPRCGTGERWSLEFQLLQLTGAYGTVEIEGGCTSGQKATITGSVETTELISYLWRVRDTLQAVMDVDARRTLSMRVWEYENGRRRYREETYHPDNVHMRLMVPGTDPEVTTTPAPRGALDPFTVLMLLRGQRLADGELHTFPIFSKGIMYEGKVKVAGRRTLEFLGQPHRTVLLLATFTRGGKPASVRAEIWLTDDDRRLPVQVQAITSYGHLTSVLTAVANAP
ncbi:MAG: DUF3108 domain-containing protein [Myxococcota bacterium]